MKIDEMMELGNILIYQTEKGDTKIDVFFQNGNIWMNQSAIARLYKYDSPKHHHAYPQYLC